MGALLPLILVVDDELKTQRFLARQLSSDFRVECASSGDEAVSLVSKHSDSASITAVIADFRMAPMSGLDLLERIREILPAAARMLTLSYADRTEVMTSNRKGVADKFITKPFDMELLRSLLQDAVKSNILRREYEALVKDVRNRSHAEVLRNLVPYERDSVTESHSCFISYSTKDEEFARRLYSRLVQANIRVWFAPEDLKGGAKLHEQLFEAIHFHDRLLLVLSEHSIASEWVMTEIRRARQVEAKEKRRKLFPIRLFGFDRLRDWSCFDSDSGKDLAIEVREYFIPDFSQWTDSESFEKAFNRLQADLRVAP